MFRLIVAFIFVYITTGANVCFNDQQSFVDYCSTFNGFVVGGQCYFYPTDSGWMTWANAYAFCIDMNATLAQIQTKSEFVKAADYIKSLGLVAPWIGLRRIEASNTGYAMTLETTFWSDETSNSINPFLIVNNTWIRNHKIDDDSPQGLSCFQMWWNGAIPQIYDETCNKAYEPLCQITHMRQTFDIVNNVCLTEVAIVEMTNSELDVCAGDCANTNWCRSFNYFADKTCQLFSWHYADGAAQDDIAGCTHYTNVDP